MLLDDGEEIARAAPPPVDAVDGTAAGDAFTACLLVSLLEGRARTSSRSTAPVRPGPSRLRASAHSLRCRPPPRSTRSSLSRHDRLAATHRPRLRSGSRRRDRAPARAREPGARAARRDDDVRQPDAREDDRERAAGARARRPADVPLASGADEPLERPLVVAAHVHGDSGLDGPALPPPSVEPVSTDAVDWIADAVAAPQTGDARSHRPAHERRPLPRGPWHDGIERIVLMGGAIAEGNMTPAAEFNIWADPEAARSSSTPPRRDDDRPRRDAQGRHRPGCPAPATRGGLDRRLRRGAGRLLHRLPPQTYGWDGAPIHDAVASPTSLRPGSWRRSCETSRSSSSPSSAADGPSSTSGSAPTARRTPTSASTSTPTPSSTCLSTG